MYKSPDVFIMTGYWLLWRESWNIYYQPSEI